MLLRWLAGGGLFGGALALGQRRAAWIASDGGQRWIARGFVLGLGAVAAAVAVAEETGALEELTRDLGVQ